MKSKTSGFTLIEIIVVFVLLGLLCFTGAEFLRSVVQGYQVARGSDGVAQKAQVALNRMSIEFAYVDPTEIALNSGSATSLTYTAHLPTGDEAHGISLSGNQLLYTVNGNPKVLTDDVAANGLALTYYTTYDVAPTNTLSATTTMIGINLQMHDEAWTSGVNKTFSTRVLLNKAR